MLPRISAALIIVFWLVMSALLVRLEISPERSRLLDVPVSHVVRLMLDREQQSLLTITESEGLAGTLLIRPVNTVGGGGFEFSGSMSIRLPMWNAQRVSWNGGVDLDKRLNTQGFHADLALRNPPYRFVLNSRTAEQTVSYEVREGDQLLTRGAVPMDSTKAPAALQGLGVDVSGLLALQKNFAGNAAPVFTAKQAELPAKGERLDVYQVTMRQGDTTLADIFVSQLGQVLLVKTTFGYTLSAEGL